MKADKESASDEDTEKPPRFQRSLITKHILIKFTFDRVNHWQKTPSKTYKIQARQWYQNKPFHLFKMSNLFMHFMILFYNLSESGWSLDHLDYRLVVSCQS